jgi:hypothetical protein
MARLDDQRLEAARKEAAIMLENAGYGRGLLADPVEEAYWYGKAANVFEAHLGPDHWMTVQLLERAKQACRRALEKR